MEPHLASGIITYYNCYLFTVLVWKHQMPVLFCRSPPIKVTLKGQLRYRTVYPFWVAAAGQPVLKICNPINITIIEKIEVSRDFFSNF